jgi:two-component system sensor histidine kinase QseC
MNRGGVGVASWRLRSLKSRLLAPVLGLVGLVWLVVVVSTWWDTEHEVGELLDAHMSQAASLLVSLPLDELTRLSLSETPTLHEYQPKVVFQVLHLDDQVVRSSTAPEQPLAAKGVLGFSQTVIEGRSWRVFSTPGLDEHVVIHVGEQDDARDDVVFASLRSVVWPMTLALPVLVLLVWGAVEWAVRPLRDLGWRVSHRQPDVADPLPLADVPQEAQPLVQELNRLFDRTATLIHAERRFTADAAHELRTPIAAIRMQAQVAQGARDESERNDALAATLQGCDRATRLVVQLLQLARVEAETVGTGNSTDAHLCLRQVLADLGAVAARRHQRLEAMPFEGVCPCPVPEALVAVLMRNLLDNALRYSPDHARVRIRTERLASGNVRLTVEDSGPGLAPEDLARLGERFFRVVGTQQPGSGLGWSIVARVASLYGLRVELGRSAELGGLRVDIGWA